MTSHLELARAIIQMVENCAGDTALLAPAIADILTVTEVKARSAERKAIIQELSACPETLRVRLKQHPSYSCECALTIATWLATTRRRRDGRVS